MIREKTHILIPVYSTIKIFPYTVLLQRPIIPSNCVLCIDKVSFRLRIPFIRDRLAPGDLSDQPLAGLRILDAGCGAGIVSESLGKLPNVLQLNLKKTPCHGGNIKTHTLATSSPSRFSPLLPTHTRAVHLPHCGRGGEHFTDAR